MEEYIWFDSGQKYAEHNQTEEATSMAKNLIKIDRGQDD